MYIIYILIYMLNMYIHIDICTMYSYPWYVLNTFDIDGQYLYRCCDMYLFWNLYPISGRVFLLVTSN